MTIAAGIHLPATKHATLAIQKVRNGRSDSSELPLTTNAGTATNSSVAHSGCGEKRFASDHIASAATTKNRMEAVRNGRSDSSELPLTTNAGTATNSSVAHSGCGEKRFASDHIASAATT